MSTSWSRTQAEEQAHFERFDPSTWDDDSYASTQVLPLVVGPEIPHIPVTETERAEMAAYEALAKDDGRPKNVIDNNAPRKVVETRKSGGMGIVPFVLVGFALLLAACGVDLSAQVAALPTGTSTAETATPEPTRGMSAAQQAMLAVQVTATANQLLGDALNREIAAGQATQGAQITAEAARQSLAMTQDAATQQAAETQSAWEVTATAQGEIVIATQIYKTEAAQTLALSVADGERKQAAFRAEADYAPIKWGLQNVAIPLVIAFGLIIVALVTLAPIGRGIGAVIEAQANRPTEAESEPYTPEIPGTGRTQSVHAGDTERTRLINYRGYTYQADYLLSIIRGVPQHGKLPAVRNAPDRREYERALSMLVDYGLAEGEPGRQYTMLVSRADYHRAVQYMVDGKAPGFVRDMLAQTQANDTQEITSE